MYIEFTHTNQWRTIICEDGLLDIFQEAGVVWINILQEFSRLWKTLEEKYSSTNFAVWAGARQNPNISLHI